MRAAAATVACVACAVVAAGLLAYVPAHDPDTWWHLATGRAALATRSTLPVDPFSFSFAGAPWRYKDLVADVGIWAAWAGGGLGGLWVLALATGAAMALAWRRLTARALPLVLTLAVTLPALPWAVRPNLLSLALFAWVLVLLERRRFGWLLVLSWLWIVLHRAALLGYVLMAARALQLLLAAACARRPRLSIVVGAPPPSRRTVRTALALALVAPLVGLLNPAGRAAFVSAVDVAGSALLRVYIAEWRRVGLAAWAGFSGALFLGALIVAAARLAVAVRRGRRAPVDAWHLGLLLLLGVLATQSIRWLPYLALATGYVLLLLVDELAAALPPRRAAAAALLAALALLVAAFVERHGAPFTLAEDATVEPSGAVAFARAHHLDGPLLHSYEFGGYLLWRGLPVLVDGRLDQVYPPAFVATCIQAERNPAFLARLPLSRVGWAIGSNSPARHTHQYLFRDPAWAMVYWSEAASVYVRRDAHPELLPLAFVAVDPAAPELSVAQAVRSGDGARLAAVHAELGRMLAESPASLRANSALAIYFHLLGRTRERDAVMEVLRAVAGDHPAVRELERRFHGN